MCNGKTKLGLQPEWWSTSAFSTNERVLNFFCEQIFEVLNLSLGWGAKLEAFYNLAPQHY
jgi:hypothetical protein